MVRHLLAVLALPFNVLVTIPALILWRTEGFHVPPLFAFSTDVGVASMAVGLTLMIATIGLFVRVGRGTLAPWSPTERLVVQGPYRWVRNPMISGVLFVLLGEALVFRSAGVFAWWAFFLLGNSIYMPLSEEPGLEARFGEAYLRYKREVPRWLPRLSPVPATPSDDDPAEASPEA
jgi:protein-S-isoprenylcysteine O-methyltransferase Ste14